ncbi:hypothetical protein K1719_003106 [Acacia pycnantha]|nr:hypothetical protein K1719_003106 [Acacia pycnantha]
MWLLTNVEHRATKIMEGNNAYLSPDIIINILKRLPVNSLIRFQCVCKIWKNLLKDPFFISDHLHHSGHRPSLLLHRPFLRNEQLHFRLLDCDSQLREIDPSPFMDYLSSSRIVDYLSRLWIIGSSNGLLCLYCRSSHDLLLWNPSIKEVRKISRNIDFESEFPIGFWPNIGFGFSTIANDYKIIIIYVSGPLRNHYFKRVNRAELYSLSKGLWKDVELGTLEGVHVYPQAATACNGAIFWVGLKQSDIWPEIVSFDIATEMFTLIPIPNIRPGSILTSDVYDNKLALLSYYDMRTIESRFIDLWVIEENTCASGGKRTWTKKYSGSPDLYPYFLIPENIWRNEIVCRVNLSSDHMRNLYLLNPTTHEFRKLVIDHFDYGVYTFNYVESLVPVSNLHTEEPKSY